VTIRTRVEKVRIQIALSSAIHPLRARIQALAQRRVRNLLHQHAHLHGAILASDPDDDGSTL
jgi:hypothetical protein